MRDLLDREHLLSWWDGKVHRLLIDLAVALVFSGVLDTRATPWEFCLYFAAAAALLVRRRFPLVTAGASVVLIALLLYPPPSWAPLSSHARRHGAAASTWVVGIAIIASGVAVNVIRYPPEQVFPTLLTIGVNSALYTVPAMLGLWLHQRQALLAAARERIERAERERALLTGRAVTEERRRIARELHDVIAHRASVMSLQAGALTLHAKDEGTAQTAEIIRENSAKALTELRGMLRVLREGPSDLSEAPTVADIAELVRDTGSGVRLSMPDDLPPTSGSTGRAAYRVAQEALTNAAQHAPGAPVSVVVEAGDELTVTVTNGPGAQASTAGPGYGLLGMRERVALAGGSLQVGPTADGGFRVAAALPR